MSSDSLLIDKTVKGLENYTVHEHLGSGATSDVFRVTNKQNNRTYVLKQMSLQSMDEEEQLRAKKEILVMNGVDHPNVVKFRESFAGVKSVDIIMEYCECSTLEHLIERQRYEEKPFPGDVIIEWMAELLCALAHIHSKRIVHRDIKTSNIFVTAKNHLKLGDFGVCTVLTNANQKPRSMIGTPLYFAPEVCDGLPYDDRSDVWSLGIVFYEMCTLRKPFEATHFLSLIQKILEDDVAPFNTGLDSSFEEIVRKMLSKKPRDRPTAQVLIEEHLEVPTSHPSHPSQKPFKGRLMQQYSGPELHYEKPWPPPANADEEEAEDGSESLYASWDAATPTLPSDPSAATEPISDLSPFVEEIVVSVPVKTASKQKGQSVASPAQSSPKTLATRVVSPAPASAVVKRRSAARSVPSTSPLRKKVPLRQRNVSSSTKGIAKDDKRAKTLPVSVYQLAGTPRVDMREVEEELLKTRVTMFGDTDEVLTEDAPVVMCNDLNTLGAVTWPSVPSGNSTFLEEVTIALNHHTTAGEKIDLDQLDTAVLLLNQYKWSQYGNV